MLNEYLAAHPFKVRYQPQFTHLTHLIAPEDRAELIDLAAHWRSQPYPVLTAGMYADFIRTGSRKSCENPYFDRRRKLTCAALHAWATCDDLDLPVVEDGLWLLCEETTWAISAHANLSADHPFPDANATIIDLFAAQTGMILSFIAQMLENRLHPDLFTRVKSEVEKRILRPFMDTDEEWWMGFRRKDLNNWTPWVVSNVLMSANVWRFGGEGLIERACGMLDRWLDCVPEDGGCDEGAAYWNMAAGAFLDCLQMLETTCGVDLWGSEKVRRMMAYPEKMHLGGGWFANFADCDARPFISSERLVFAGVKTGNPALVRMGDGMRGPIARELNDVPHLSRLLMRLTGHHAASAKSADVQEKDVWLPDLQVRIVSRGSVTLCAKGGHNAESHNHNDVGTFMVMADGRMQVIDAGNMVYTAKTFSNRRYELWNCRAAYHNVPMIGEVEQQPGISFAAKDAHRTDTGMTLDLADAYPAEAGVTRLHRELRADHGGVTVADDITLAENSPVTWVFMLRDEPVITGNASIGRETAFTLHWPDTLSANVERIDVTDERMRKSYPGTIWRLTLTSQPDAHHHAAFRFGTTED